MRRGAVALACLLAGCGGGDDGGADAAGPPRPLLADLTDAVGIGIAKPTGGSTARLVPADPDAGTMLPDAAAPPQRFSTLVKIDPSGAALPVLDQSVPVFSELVTSTHVVVSGLFQRIADAGGDAIDCSLVAIPLGAAGEPVKCLLDDDWLTADSFAASTILGGGDAPAIDKPGMAALGDDVYFAQQVCDPDTPGICGSELRHWASGADQTDLLIHLDHGGGSRLFQPIVADGAADLCVASDGDSLMSPGGSIFCGPLAGDDWADTGVIVGGGTSVSLGPDVLQVGHVLLANAAGSMNMIDLNDGTTMAAPPGLSVPALWSLTATTSDGRVFALSGGGAGTGHELDLLDDAGTVTVVDDTVTWTRFIGDGTYAWVYGGSKLQRFDRTTAILDPTNYLGDTTLLQVTDMSFSSANRIRIDGTAASGQPVVVAIATDTGEIQVTGEDLPRLSAVTPLQ